ncbi:Crp/Fnr family transcriptional regulator [Methylobacterium sp. Leaf113]|uniref:Crp/Fnr family transcriptional regulator n=1 Tax=Methylobacterium sp. Leaf113 TaxID=1736259 RepID=UPI0009E6BBB2|nr:Crp/Fnr family transcriptional regulator [Methylobacterium sp. Leaf113]
MNARLSLVPATPVRTAEPDPGRNPLIRKLQSLVSLNAADVAALEEISLPPRLLGPRVDLIRGEEGSGDAVMLLEGFACRYKQRQAGQRQIMAYLLPGDLCDVDASYLGRMDHAVGTLASSVVVRIRRQALADLVARHPNIAQALRMARLFEEATTREWVVNLGCRSAMERMAHLFCELLTRFQMVGMAEGDSCPLPLTQADLGDTLGLSNVHVNRTLQELRRQGLVELRGKSLRLLKVRRLQEIGEFNPAYLQPVDGAKGHAAFGLVSGLA